MDTKDKTSHIGRKIARIRELRGMKQDALAMELGVSQQSISKLEQSETVEDEMLERVAKVLGLNAEAVKSFNEDAVISYINTFYQEATINGSVGSTNFSCTFNPIDKIVDLYEENKKLMERLLESEREKVEILKGRK